MEVDLDGGGGNPLETPKLNQVILIVYIQADELSGGQSWWLEGANPRGTPMLFMFERVEAKIHSLYQIRVKPNPTPHIIYELI